jgi:pimeloyl-ACP methyl ester carboxylesterase
MKTFSKPGFAGLLGETRIFGEVASFALYSLFHQALQFIRPHRGGVLLIPGFGAGDLSLSPLGGGLRELGYKIFYSGIWCNVYCPAHMLPRLEKVLRKASRKTRGKIVIIGHSLGGIYARELACRFSELVERVMLLGSPVKAPLEGSNTFLRPLFEWAHKGCPDTLETISGSAEVEMSPRPPRVPETLLYSKTDGVVQWQNCVESAAHVEAIEIPSSHCGLPFHHKAFEIIVDRLARGSERSHPVTANSALPKHRRLHRLRTCSLQSSVRGKSYKLVTEYDAFVSRIWLTKTMESKRQNVLLEGSTAGMLGASVVALWFLIVDLSRGRMFATPALLGALLLRGGAAPASLRSAAEYSVVHFAVFVIFGVIASGLMKTSERHPAFLSGVLLLFSVFEFFFLALVVVVSLKALQTLIWWRIVVGNILATAAMLAFFAVRHPWLVARFKTKLRNSRGITRSKDVRLGKRTPSSVLDPVPTDPRG